MYPTPYVVRWLVAVGVLSAVASCASVREVMALRDVRFDFERVTDVEVAGIALDGITSATALTLGDAGRLATAVSARDVPLSLSVRLLATNPAENGVDARLVRMDWTLLLEGRETVSGVFDDEIRIPAGGSSAVTVPVSLNLVEFFEGSARDLVNLALAVTGQGGAPTEVAVRVSPEIRTVLGPLRYPEPIVVARRTVGGI